MIDPEVLSAIALVKSDMMMLRAEIDAEKQFPVFQDQLVSHFIPEASAASIRVIAFGCSSAGLVVTVKQGKVYFKGVSKTITDWPTDGEVTLTDTTYGYIEIDLANATATWKTAASDPGDGDDDTEIWRIFVATVSSGAITELLECQHGDIHCMGNA